jgi:hypothetical protein
MDDGNGNAVRVTLTMIYANQEKMREELADIKEGIAVHLALGAHPQAAKELEDHETRIRGLTAWKNAIPASVIVALASLAIALLRRG